MIDIGYLLMAENTQCFSNWLFVKETDYRDITSVVDKAKQKQEYPFWTHFTSSIPEFSSFTDLQLNPPAFRQSRLGRKNTCCFFLFSETTDFGIMYEQSGKGALRLGEFTTCFLF